MADKPSKTDLEAVFNRLRAIPANKVCFDCSAKNPTWASVTYGVFICIDCSAVHRNLGVHLTFVRSTQLDTNWTWVQMRQMQVGGNANASQFFAQHNCFTTDANKKYNSRAAQLYRDKLNQLAVQSLNANPGKCINDYDNGGSLNLHGNAKLHVHTEPLEEPKAEKEVDFFSEHENFSLNNQQQESAEDLINSKLSQLGIDNGTKTASDSGAQPSVDFIANADNSNAEERKSIIGVRKIQPKKAGLGGKKGGLGATKVKTNFADLEKEAAAAEEYRARAAEEMARAAALSAEQQAEREAAVRLAYKDLSLQQQENEKQLKKSDPKKAEQVERLGMGFASRSGVSHSALSDMQCIEQENLQSSSASGSNLDTLSKIRATSNRSSGGSSSSNAAAAASSDTDSFFDDFSFSSGFNMNRNYGASSNGSSAGGGANRAIEAFLAENSASTGTSAGSSSWGNVNDTAPKPRIDRSARTVDSSGGGSAGVDLAQKKFGGAKAISSDQYFDSHHASSGDYESQTALNRFQGSTSISSADLFGTGQGGGGGGANAGPQFHAPDLDEVRESVRQGVHKVAGKLSSLANGVMSSIQDRYGY